MEVIFFGAGYLLGLIIKIFVLEVDQARRRVRFTDEVPYIAYSKAIIQIFINALIIAVASQMMGISSSFFSIGLFAAQSTLLGVTIFENIEKSGLFKSRAKSALKKSSPSKK